MKSFPIQFVHFEFLSFSFLETGSFFLSIDDEKFNDSRILYRFLRKKLCQHQCFLTFEQTLVLVDFADPEYQNSLRNLIEIHDIISHENIQNIFQSNRNEIHIDEFSSMIFPQRQV